jgi:hypothetical protein
LAALASPVCAGSAMLALSSFCSEADLLGFKVGEQAGRFYQRVIFSVTEVRDTSY